MRNATVLALAIALLVVVACSSDKATAPQTVTPEPTPDISATVRAQVKATTEALSAAEIEPTPAPVLDGRELVAFATLHGAIETRWESFHGVVDGWRQGLLTCDLTFRNHTVSVFASRFAEVPEGARSLPRNELVRSIADQIIAAAEREAAALRGLSEAAGTAATVILPDGSTASAAEFVAIERAAAAGIRLTAEATLTDLTSGASLFKRTALNGFASDLSDINNRWDQFITDYEAFRASQPELSVTESADAINALVNQFLSISADVNALSLASTTVSVTEQLSQATRATELALRTLRDAIVEASRAVEVAKSSTGNGDGSTTIAAEPQPLDFITFETQLVAANGDQSAAAALLSPIVGSASGATASTVSAFSTAYGPVAASWDRFHEEYDAWRASNGGCDVTDALETLGEFVVDFGGIATDVRAAPRTTALRTLGELLIEAAEREAQAVSGLRASWRPFDASAYEQFDLSRAAANKLRRQVSSGLEELLAQNGISQADVSR
jgi:hypothetical protein